MGLIPVYKSLQVEKDKKSFLKGYHVDLDKIDLFINLEITDFDFETEAKNIGESILEIMQKHVNESGDQALYDRFEEALKEINFFLNDLKSKKETGDIGKMNIVIGLLEGKTLHITKTGLAEAYLLRKGNIIEISEGLYNAKGGDPNYFVNIASGDLETGDKVLFASKRLLKFVGKSDLNSMFINSDIENSFQDMRSTLMAEETGDIIINGFLLEKKVEEQKLPKQEETTTPSRSASSPQQSLGTTVISFLQKGWQKGKKLIMDFPTQIKDPTIRRNYIITLVVIIAAILLLNVTIFSNSKTKSDQLAKYEQVLQSARDLLTDAQQKKLYDVKLAKASLDEAQKKAFEVARSGVYFSDAQKILQDIDNEETLMDKITRIDNPVVLVNLAKKDPTIDAIKLVNLNQTFYAMTTSSVLGPIVDSTPDSYAKNSLENGEIIVSADKFLDRNNVVLLTKSNKLIEFKDNNFSFMNTDDTLWKPGVDIKTYGSRQYIYILDPANNNIWKYERTSKNYKGAVPYNTDKVDLKNGVSFAIDGNIYVLKSTGEVKKLYQQKLANFTIEGGPSIPLGNLDSRAKIYTNENLRNIYILDPGNARVLVYKKTTFEKPDKMTYDRQYILKGTDLRDMYIDDAEQSLYLLTPQQILKVDMKSS
jgi:hypothetical protein